MKTRKEKPEAKKPAKERYTSQEFDGSFPEKLSTTCRHVYTHSRNRESTKNVIYNLSTILCSFYILKFNWSILKAAKLRENKTNVDNNQFEDLKEILRDSTRIIKDSKGSFLMKYPSTDTENWLEYIRTNTNSNID